LEPSFYTEFLEYYQGRYEWRVLLAISNKQLLQRIAQEAGYAVLDGKRVSSPAVTVTKRVRLI